MRLEEEKRMNEIIGFAVVIVTIFAGMLFNNSHFNTIDARFASIDSRLDRMQAELNGRLDSLQTELNGRMDSMQTELNGRIDRVQGDLGQFFRELGRHDARIESIEKKAN
jgi:hypothetical protein